MQFTSPTPQTFLPDLQAGHVGLGAWPQTREHQLSGQPNLSLSPCSPLTGGQLASATSASMISGTSQETGFSLDALSVAIACIVFGIAQFEAGIRYYLSQPHSALLNTSVAMRALTNTATAMERIRT